jgi:hypothetical protein
VAQEAGILRTTASAISLAPAPAIPMTTPRSRPSVSSSRESTSAFVQLSVLSPDLRLAKLGARAPRGGSPALRFTRYFCNRTLEQSPTVRCLLLLVAGTGGEMAVAQRFCNVWLPSSGRGCWRWRRASSDLVIRGALVGIVPLASAHGDSPPFACQRQLSRGRRCGVLTMRGREARGLGHRLHCERGFPSAGGGDAEPIALRVPRRDSASLGCSCAC